MRALLALALLLAAPAALAAPPKPAPAAAPKKVGELDLCKLQLLSAAEADASLKRQVVDLQKQLLEARAELQAMRVAEERKRVLQQAGVAEGQDVDLNTGEVKPAEKGK